jgi:hypothetical protein
LEERGIKPKNCSKDKLHRAMIWKAGISQTQQDLESPDLYVRSKVVPQLFEGDVGYLMYLLKRCRPWRGDVNRTSCPPHCRSTQWLPLDVLRHVQASSGPSVCVYFSCSSEGRECDLCACVRAACRDLDKWASPSRLKAFIGVWMQSPSGSAQRSQICLEFWKWRGAGYHDWRYAFIQSLQFFPIFIQAFRGIFVNSYNSVLFWPILHGFLWYIQLSYMCLHWNSPWILRVDSVRTLEHCWLQGMGGGECFTALRFGDIPKRDCFEKAQMT